MTDRAVPCMVKEVACPGTGLVADFQRSRRLVRLTQGALPVFAKPPSHPTLWLFLLSYNVWDKAMKESLRMDQRDIDRALVERVLRGDKQAFALLVQKYQRRLSRLLARYVADPGELEDVVQETFIKAYKALPSFRKDSAFYTWLYRIGINAAKNYLIAQDHQPELEQTADGRAADESLGGAALHDLNTPESEMLSREVAETVNRAVAGLPEELKTAITLREIEGLSYEDIAALMNCPIGTVRSRIYRAREVIAAQLRPLLGSRDER